MINADININSEIKESENRIIEYLYRHKKLPNVNKLIIGLIKIPQ